jgi:hypothetical protein
LILAKQFGLVKHELPLHLPSNQLSQGRVCIDLCAAAVAVAEVVAASVVCFHLIC